MGKTRQQEKQVHAWTETSKWVYRVGCESRKSKKGVEEKKVQMRCRVKSKQNLDYFLDWDVKEKENKEINKSVAECER